MPPKKRKAFRILPRGSEAPAPKNESPTPPTPGTIVARLRQQMTLMDADELAEVLKYTENKKRVYSLPIPRCAVGPDAVRALRWDPSHVADYLERRMQPPSSQAS